MPMHLFLRHSVAVFFLAGVASIHAETLTLSSRSTTSAELPAAVSEALEHLAATPGQSHRLILQGEFTPTSTIKILWWGDQPLTVSGPALLDGSHMPDQSETVFMAGRNLTLEGLHFTNSPGHAVVVGGGSDNYTVQDCVFEDCRRSAIHAWNNPYEIVDSPGRRGTIRNNRITRFNLDDAKWANDGITVYDQRVAIAGNYIADSPTESNGIRAMGRELLVEHNVVHSVSRDDSGGIYLWGGPHAYVFRGNIVRGNHVVGASRGIYLDDGTSGARVEENIIQDSAVCAIFLSGGRDNVVERNVADRAPVFVHLDSRCLAWDSRPEYAELAALSIENLRDILAESTAEKLFTSRYPELRGLTAKHLTLDEYGQPKANRVSDNFVRNIASTWELMDFSVDVKTDFLSLNRLSDPQIFGGDEDLSLLNLRGRFGFTTWDSSADIGPRQDP
ncbi:MAG: right-handed parallel beta-helix repeat-containing protein [Planctomycetota bacterium]